MNIAYSLALGISLFGLVIVGVLLYNALIALYRNEQMLKGAVEARKILAENGIKK